MNSFHVRPDCTQLLIECNSCGELDVLEVPYPVVHCPCPNCDAPVLVEAIVITTRTLSISAIRRHVKSWVEWHGIYNLSQTLWANMLRMPYKHREP